MPLLPLLAAKLFPPPHPGSLVPRPRLTQKIEDGVRAGRKVTLVCAPAGFGKTTLVVEWLERFKHPGSAALSFGWLSLDTSDNHLLGFLQYLLAALQAIQPGLGLETQSMLEGSRLPSHESLLLPLLNDLHRLSTPCVLILDDYHTLQSPEIHEAMAFIIDRQPPQMHTILTTRQDPLLPISRWRARGQLTDVRLSELRFNEAEAAEFLNRSMGLDLSAADVAALEARTEGWIAGLQMAAISMQQNDSGCDGCAADFVRTFTGDDRFVMDYLVDEVLGRQPQPVQEFLLRTSILDRFNAGLCQAVVEDAPDGAVLPGEQLAYLERANLFLIPLDNRRQWYRYHHLFAELLRYRLSARGAAFVVALQRSASRWCDQNEMPDQAIHYAQAAGDWALSEQLILKYSPLMIRHGEIVNLMRWIRAMPEAEIRRSPFLCRDYAYALTQNGQLKAAEQYFQLAEQGFAGNPDLLGSTLVFASYNALFRGEFAHQVGLARRSLELLSPGNTWMRGIALLSLGIGLLHRGDLVGAETACREAFSLAQHGDAVRTCINALDQLGRVCVLRLDFVQAENYFRRAAQYQSGGRLYPSCDLPLFDLAMLFYQQNALDQALECVTQGLEANQRSGSIEMRAYGLRLAARIYQLQGNASEAGQYLHKALQLSGAFDLSPLTLSLNAALEVQMALHDGDLRRAEQAAPQVTNSLGVYPFIFYPEMARVQFLLAQGDKEAANQLLSPALERISQPEWAFPRLQVRLLQALAAPDLTQARAPLQEALRMACQANAMRTLLDLGEPLRALIQACSLRFEEPALRTFMSELLNAFPGASTEKVTLAKNAGANDAAPQSVDLVEPLSEREIEVLRLLADGLSNLEIAQRLYLSPNTLKAHTQNIYAKLDVHSRVQAVNRARELGLIR